MTKTTEFPERWRLGVLASGRGSNLDALLRRRERLPADFACVVANRQAPALDIAAAAGVPAVYLPARKGEPREDYDARVTACLLEHGVNFVVLAGYMRIVSEPFIAAWDGRLVNIHPSLLPAFPGLDPHQQAIDRGVKLAGATVHFVQPGPVDGGAIIAQRSVPVTAHDDAHTLAARVLAVEHELYTDALAEVLSGRLRLDGDRVIEGAAR